MLATFPIHPFVFMEMSCAQPLQASPASPSTAGAILTSRQFKSQAEAPRRSKFRGLCWDKKERRWRVRINVGGKQHHVGRFYSEIEAARAFDRVALAVYGQNAITNFGQEAAAADHTPLPATIQQLKLALQQNAAQQQFLQQQSPADMAALFHLPRYFPQQQGQGVAPPQPAPPGPTHLSATLGWAANPGPLQSNLNEGHPAPMQPAMPMKLLPLAHGSPVGAGSPGYAPGQLVAPGQQLVPPASQALVPQMAQLRLLPQMQQLAAQPMLLGQGQLGQLVAAHGLPASRGQQGPPCLDPPGLAAVAGPLAPAPAPAQELPLAAWMGRSHEPASMLHPGQGVAAGVGLGPEEPASPPAAAGGGLCQALAAALLQAGHAGALTPATTISDLLQLALAQH